MPGRLFGGNKRRHVVANVTALVGEEADDHGGMRAQPVQRVGGEGCFLQARGLDAGEKFRRRHARCVRVQGQRSAGGAGRSVANHQNGSGARWNTQTVARGQGMALDQPGHAVVDADRGQTRIRCWAFTGWAPLTESVCEGVLAPGKAAGAPPASACCPIPKAQGTAT